jgi:hypothetical protein
MVLLAPQVLDPISDYLRTRAERLLAEEVG